jgi:hypothetical protein
LLSDNGNIHVQLFQIASFIISIAISIFHHERFQRRFKK